MEDSNKHALHRILKISLVSNVVLGLVLAAAILIKNLNNDELIAINADQVTPQYGEASSVDLNNDSVCITCDYLGKTITANDTLYDRIVTTDCGHKLCCIRESIIQNFVKAVSQSTKENTGTVDRHLRKSLKWWRKRPQAAHLYLDREDPFSDEGKLRWKGKDAYGTAFTNGLELVNGTHIEILKEGHYFIYAAVSFNHKSQNKVDVFYHTLIKRHPNLPNRGDTILVMNKYGGSRDSDKHHTNYLAGIHHIQHGYQIGSVLSGSAHDFLDRSSSVANYFGIIRI